MDNKPQKIDNETKNVLKNYFSATDDLMDKGIIRSSKYIADIAEYLCQEIYGITLCENQRKPGYDGVDKGNKKYQIKMNNSKKRTNQYIGNPQKYDFLLLMITSNSKLFIPSIEDTFISVYRINSKNLLGRKYIAKKYIRQETPEFTIDNDFNR